MLGDKLGEDGRWFRKLNIRKAAISTSRTRLWGTTPVTSCICQASSPISNSNGRSLPTLGSYGRRGHSPVCQGPRMFLEDATGPPPEQGAVGVAQDQSWPINASPSGLSITNLHVPSACRRRTSAVASSAVEPLGSLIVQDQCTRARSPASNTTESFMVSVALLSRYPLRIARISPYPSPLLWT